MSDANTDISRIEAKLDILIRLMALSVAPDNLSQTDRAIRLQRAGLPPKDIASLMGTTSGTVRTALHGAKKRKGNGRKAKNG